MTHAATSPHIRVLVAPDSFKGTMSASVVAAALAAGVRDAGAVADSCPVADGGEGTLEALRAGIGGQMIFTLGTGPHGTVVPAHFLLSDDGTTAVVETATASGLHLVDPDPASAWSATSAGTGDLLAAAVRAGARHLLLGVGGSACTDGGAGALAAIKAAGGLRGATVTVLCDVTTPYDDAAGVYGPQKGADPATVDRLSARLKDTATILPKDPRGVPRTGAAGGLAGGLWAALDAELVSGIDTVLEQVGAGERLRLADAVFTGEGRLDVQTVQGKVIDGVTRWAATAEIPVYAVVGQNRAEPAIQRELGLLDVREAGDPQTIRAAARQLTKQLITATPPAAPGTTNTAIMADRK